ncbi:hypothetical protein GCM10010471_00720 [Leucobacter komagatae]
MGKGKPLLATVGLGIVIGLVGVPAGFVTSAQAGYQAAFCGSSNRVVHGESAYGSVDTYSGYNKECGQLQVSATYGTKCGLRSAWTYGYGHVAQLQSKTCTGWHKSATSSAFTTAV